MELAVNMPEQEPQVGQADSSTWASPSSETASLAELAAKARGVVVTLDEPVIRQRVATVRETLSHLGE